MIETADWRSSRRVGIYKGLAPTSTERSLEQRAGVVLLTAKRNRRPHKQPNGEGVQAMGQKSHFDTPPPYLNPRLEIPGGGKEVRNSKHRLSPAPVKSIRFEPNPSNRNARESPPVGWHNARVHHQKSKGCRINLYCLPAFFLLTLPTSTLLSAKCAVPDCSRTAKMIYRGSC